MINIYTYKMRASPAPLRNVWRESLDKISQIKENNLRMNHGHEIIWEIYNKDFLQWCYNIDGHMIYEKEAIADS